MFCCQEERNRNMSKNAYKACLITVDIHIGVIALGWIVNEQQKLEINLCCWCLIQSGAVVPDN